MNLSLVYPPKSLCKLPPEFGRLTQLATLNIDNNPLEDPPPEVIRQGTQAILNYLRQKLETGLDKTLFTKRN